MTANRVTVADVRAARRAWARLSINERDRWSNDQDGFIATHLSGGVIPADFIEDDDD